MHTFLWLPLGFKPGGVAKLSSMCHMTVAQFHWTGHLDDLIFPETWRSTAERELSAMSQTLCLTYIINQLE